MLSCSPWSHVTPKYLTPGLSSFCGFPAWSQKTSDCVIPGNQTASSVKLTSLSDVISKIFHLKSGFLVIDMILTCIYFNGKCTFLKTKPASSFLAHHKLIPRCSKVTTKCFIKLQICWKHLPLTVIIPEDAKPQTLLL